MKGLLEKTLKISVIIAICFTIICCVIDRVYIGKTQESLFKFMNISGGEIGGTVSAFGWFAETYYPLTNDPINNPTTTTISFNIFAFLGGFIIVFACTIVIVLFISIIINLIKKIGDNKEGNEQKWVCTRKSQQI